MPHNNFRFSSPEGEVASAEDVRVLDLADTSDQLDDDRGVSIQLDKIAYECPSPKPYTKTFTNKFSINITPIILLKYFKNGFSKFSFEIFSTYCRNPFHIKVSKSLV